jgi:hypothetical protein
LIWINRSRRVAPSMRQRGPRLVMQEVLKGLKKTETPGSTVTSIARASSIAAAPKRKARTARAKVSAVSKGVIRTTLGGKLPPVSVLSRREFGLRAARR